MPDNRALTAEEVAKQLQIAKNTVYELIKRGELKSYKVGRKVRIDSSDLEEYITRSKAGAVQAAQEQDDTATFVISGQDSTLDILADMLQNHPDGVPVYRSYLGSFPGLTGLYYDKCHIAAIHLYDGENDTYNTSFVRHLVPGIPCIILHIAKRVQGFYVKKGNPKNITDWVDLSREDITMINREKGSGTRVLLDEKMRSLSIYPSEVNGYYQEKTSHFAIANTVASGSADVGIGCQAMSLRVGNLDFIPLHTESYDIVMKKENLEDPTYKLLYDLINSTAYRESLSHLTGYDISNLGEIVAET